MQKRDIPTIAQKNRIIGNILDAMTSRRQFVLVGHENPDDDCIASMVAFAILLSKLGKRVQVVTCGEIHDHFQYLLNICRFNSIGVVEDCASISDRVDTFVAFDTPKPAMLEPDERVRSLFVRDDVLKMEFDHHLDSDSAYIGQEGYAFVAEASSSSELVGMLGLKMRSRTDIIKAHGIQELLSRNFVLAVLTGIIGDSKMGKYLKTRKEKRFYALFSELFEQILVSKTRKSSGNFSSMEEVFEEIERLSSNEERCFKYMMDREKPRRFVHSVMLSEADMATLRAEYDYDTIVAIARYAADKLAEASRYLSLIAYYDDPSVSDLIQFRMRRSETFKAIDLRGLLETLQIKNGGGHPGAIGFRIERDEISDLPGFIEKVIAEAEALVETTVAGK